MFLNRIGNGPDGQSDQLPVVLIRRAIARLSDRDLQRMNCGDLVDMVRMSGVLPADSDLYRRVEWFSETNLRSFAARVRRLCRTHFFPRSSTRPYLTASSMVHRHRAPVA